LEIFSLTLTQMLMIFSLIITGFLLRKTNIVGEEAVKVLSRVETYALVPALTFNNFMGKCTVENFTRYYSLMFYGLGVITVSVILAYLISGFFVKYDGINPELKYKRNIYKYSLTFGNFGFMGNFIILGIWGDMEFFKYSMFTFFINMTCNIWGLLVLIPDGEEKPSIKATVAKAITAPPVLAVLFGILAGLFNLSYYLPDFIKSALSGAGGCMCPIAMLLAGIVIGGYRIKDILKEKKVYILSLLRLIVLPGVFITLLTLLKAPSDVLIFTLVAFATPLGLNTIIYPATYGGETKTGAAMNMISNTFSVITIPLIYYFFIELLPKII